MLQIGIGKASYEVLAARDGEEAIRLWRDSRADLRELQANSSATPVIALTDGGRSKNLNPLSYSKVLGAVRTIAKPFTLETMLALVRETLETPRR